MGGRQRASQKNTQTEEEGVGGGGERQRASKKNTQTEEEGVGGGGGGGGRQRASKLGVGRQEGFTLLDENSRYIVMVNPEQWWIILGVAHPSVR